MAGQGSHGGAVVTLESPIQSWIANSASEFTRPWAYISRHPALDVLATIPARTLTVTDIRTLPRTVPPSAPVALPALAVCPPSL